MIQRLWKALGYACSGLASAFKSEFAFRLELWLASALIPLAFFVTFDLLERVLLIAVILLVIVVELINTAIEAAIDRMGEEQHPLAKKSKDCGAAAVLVALILAAVVWVGVLLS